MHYRGILLTVLLLAPPLQAQAPDIPSALRLRPGDHVRLQVGGEPELTGDFAVTEGGVVLLPLIGVVRVVGRPFAEVRDEIGTRFAAEVVDAPVLVTPVLRVPVLGEVQQPGLMPVDPTLTIADVVAAAGGLTPRGDPSRVWLIRDGASTRISLDGARVASMPPLLPGDRIVVGRRGWLAENFNAVLAASATVLAATITSLILR
jgi:protein involved in polysaccharide export with SLBB domain